MTTHTSRRVMLDAIALPALAIPHCRSPSIREPDPVYAAIAGYKAANTLLCACIDKEAEIDKRIGAPVAAVVDKRMKIRIAFEAASPEHTFTCSKTKCANASHTRKSESMAARLIFLRRKL